MTAKRKPQKLICLGAALALCFSLITPVTAADDPLASAVPVSMEQTMNGTLTAGHQTDLYRLDVQSSGTLTYKLEFYMAALDVRLLNQDGQVIKAWRQRQDGGLQPGSAVIGFSVEQGVYYVQLKRRSGDGAYTLIQTFDGAKTTEIQPNDTLETAQPLILGETVWGVIAVGYEKNARDKDVYKFDVPASKNITFTLSSRLSGVYIHLYDAEGEEIKYAFGAADKNTGRSRISRTYKLAAGSYYLLVKGGSGTGPYSLKAAEAAPPAKTAVKSLIRRGQYQNLQVNLRKAAGAEGYQICISTNAGFKQAVTYRKTKLSSSYHLAKGKTYYVKARAYRKNSEGGYIYGKFSAAKKIRL